MPTLYQRLDDDQGGERGDEKRDGETLEAVDPRIDERMRSE